MYVVKADALNHDGDIVSVYVAESALTMRQRDAVRFTDKAHASDVLNNNLLFRIVKLVPRSRS